MLFLSIGAHDLHRRTCVGGWTCSILSDAQARSDRDGHLLSYCIFSGIHLFSDDRALLVRFQLPRYSYMAAKNFEKNRDTLSVDQTVCTNYWVPQWSTNLVFLCMLATIEIKVAPCKLFLHFNNDGNVLIATTHP